MNQFVLSDESVNSYGLRVLTPGINLKRFRRNPVMYYNHDRERGVIGKWVDLRVDGDKLIGTPVFDEDDEFATKIKRKVESGFIKSASIGVDNMKISKDKAVTSCTLLECSICDIPSNGNAFMLYVDNKPIKDEKEIIKFMHNTKKESEMNGDLNRIMKFLKLSSDCTDDDVLNAINALKLSQTPSEMIEQAVKDKIIEAYEKEGLLNMAATNESSFVAYFEKRKERTFQNRKNEGVALINEAISDGRIRPDRDGKIKEFWMENYSANPELTRMALFHMKQPKRVMEFINNPGKSEDRASWTLEDYRKKAPMELKNDPALYLRLIEDEKEKANMRQ